MKVARRIARAPEGAWLNGITAGPDGRFYIADSSLATIWRLDEAAGKLVPALQSDLLKPRPFVALAPGANGVRFAGRTMYVTVSDRGTVVRSQLRSDGTLSEPSVWATGVPGDDFAVDDKGGLYITTHPYDTVVHISPDGTRTVAAAAAQGVKGAVSAAFGVAPGDRGALYVATDGGAFGGVANARGALVRLETGKR